MSNRVIKQLEWTTLMNGDLESKPLRYVITDFETIHVDKVYLAYDFASKKLGEFKTQDLAKEGCQKDFEAEVRQCLI